jgi:hypothetical protein
MQRVTPGGLPGWTCSLDQHLGQPAYDQLEPLFKLLMGMLPPDETLTYSMEVDGDGKGGRFRVYSAPKP